MKDRVHQPYRKELVSLNPTLQRAFGLSSFNCDMARNSKVLMLCQIPGLPRILSSITPSSHPGLLGICLSGAGPTILALATGGYTAIAEEAARLFKEEGIEVVYKVLDVAGGSVIE
jgi:homoserine kinase